MTQVEKSSLLNVNLSSTRIFSVSNRQVIGVQTFYDAHYVCLSKECISSGDSGSADGCRGESCISILLVETEKWDDALVSVKHRLQNISADMDPISRLNHLGAHISETKVALTQVTKVT